MEAHFDLSDKEFARQFANCTLNPQYFTHQAHLRLAWIHIIQYGINKAIENITGQISHFATSNGDTEKYHETITVAAVRTVYHFMLKSEANDFQQLLKEYPRLYTSFQSLLGSHYSDNILYSKHAKQNFIPPDLMPYDRYE